MTDVVIVVAGKLRLTAVNVAASWNAPSPAYSIRINVGERTWKRALPSVTVEAAAAAGTAVLPIRATDDRRTRDAKPASRMPSSDIHRHQ